MKQRWISILFTVMLLWGIAYIVQGSWNKEGNSGITSPASDQKKNTAGTGSVNQGSDNSEVGTQIGFEAPDFELEGMDGQMYSLSQWRGKKMVMVNFWASWCPPCRIETPDLVKLYEQYNGEVVFYGVNLTTQDSIGKVQEFMREFGMNYPVLLDTSGEVALAYNVQAIPTTYFIDKNGRIADKVIGITNAESIKKIFARINKSTAQ